MRLKLFAAIVLLISAAPFVQAQNCHDTEARYSVNITSATDTTVVAARPGRKIHIVAFYLENNHAATDVTVTLKDGTTAMDGGGQLLKAGGAAWTHTCQMPHYDTTDGSAFVVTTSAAGTISGTIWYRVE